MSNVLLLFTRWEEVKNNIYRVGRHCHVALCNEDVAFVFFLMHPCVIETVLSLLGILGHIA